MKLGVTDVNNKKTHWFGLADSIRPKDLEAHQPELTELMSTARVQKRFKDMFPEYRILSLMNICQGAVVDLYC